MIGWTQERHVGRAGVAAACVAAASACGGSGDARGGTDPRAPTVATVSIRTAPETLEVATTRPATAEARDGAGQVIPNAPITWAASDTGVLRVEGAGPTATVRGVAPGSVTVTVSAGGRTATRTLVVVPRAVARVAITPLADTVYVGQTVQLAASPLDADGGVLARPVVWGISDPARATVGPNGALRALAPGAVTVTAAVEGRSASVALTVVPDRLAGAVVALDSAAHDTVRVGREVRLTAQAVGASGASWPAGVTVVSAAPSVLAVERDGARQWVVRGLAEGDAVLVATVDGAPGAPPARRAVAVRAPALAALTLTVPGGATAPVYVGTTVQLGVTGRDETGAVLPATSAALQALTWTSSQPAVARVAPGGLVTGVAPGEAEIAAAWPGGRAAVRVSVTRVGFTALALTTGPTTMWPGDTSWLRVTGRDATGPVPVAPGVVVGWSSSAPGVVAVTPQGALRAIGLGQATVTGTLFGLSVRTTVRVLGAASPDFDIEVRYVGEVPAVVRRDLDRAVRRWRQVIAGPLPEISTERQDCGAGWPAPPARVKNLVILVRMAPLTGAVARGGPCVTREWYGALTSAVGVIEVNQGTGEPIPESADLTWVFIHEIGHVFGIGVSWWWNLPGQAPLATGVSSGDPVFTGPQAQQAFLAAGGSRYAGTPVPIATDHTHWRPGVFGVEAMVPTGSPAQLYPLSAVTLGALADLGYPIRFDAADPYTLPAAVEVAGARAPGGDSASRATTGGKAAEAVDLTGDVIRPRWIVDAAGRARRVPD